MAKILDLDQEEEEVQRIAGQLDHLQKAIKTEDKELKKTVDAVWRTQDAQEILQHLAQAVQQQAHQKIAEVVSSCLSAVFDDPYEFKIQFDRKRGKTEAHLRFVRDDLEISPLEAAGGGVVDVASFALRVACLALHRPRLSQVIVLDEPFKFVSAQYRENVRIMLEELAKDLSVQVIMVTHIEELETGKVIGL